MALTACAASSTHTSRSAPEPTTRPVLVGLSEGELLSCAGVPNRRHDVGNREYVAYESRSIRTVGLRPIFPDYEDWGDPPSQRIRISHCEATLVLENGRVTQATYDTSRGYVGGLSYCDHIFRRCVGTQPPTDAARGAEPSD
ncbi:MAG TPA: hypothetical protein VFO41_00205 [Alphaproteobacteria bacterium]|nr:hypothetical protein [Alphaproteobacteria bacterium]